jgi:DNA-3-methyladenine glycosylase II
MEACSVSKAALDFLTRILDVELRPLGISHLRTADPVLARLVDSRPTFDPQEWMAELSAMDLFGALLFQVAGQQLSVVATRRTLGRIEMLFGGRLPSPAELLEVPQDSLRQAGLSWRKVATLRDLAQRLSDGRLDPDVMRELPDDEVIAALTTIPGIGPWTAQGALILALQRQDVVLPGDLALRKAIQREYGLDHLPSQAEVCPCVRGACTPASNRADAGLPPAPPESGECGVVGSSPAWHPRPNR